MKQNLGSNFLLLVALVALAYSISDAPPGGVSWSAFVDDASPLTAKAGFLLRAYVWPGLLSCSAITLFQLQFRMASAGAAKRAVFAVCVLASGGMLIALRSIAFSPNTSPSYVAGLAAGYTLMSRLYAVRMREIVRGVRVPWPVWRGDHTAVAMLDRLMRERHAQRAEALR